MPDSTFLMRFCRQVAVVVFLAIIATACTTVSNETAVLTLNPDAIAEQAARAAADAASPEPSQANEIEYNDEGDVLLQRFINGSFEPSDCDFVDTTELPVQPECGWLIRPLLGAEGRDKDIELPVAIFEATGPDPVAEPLIYLHGGPSSRGILGSIESEEIFNLIVAPFIETRTVILFDQRGTGISRPELTCNAERYWYEANGVAPETFVSRAAISCSFGLQQRGTRLDQFSRQSSADDVMVLARELGHEQVDLHGSSWGGILAYTAMQMHPGWIRSAVLDSPLSITTDLTGSMPASFLEAMQAVQANCDLSSDCSSRHGNIIERYERVFDAFEGNPLRLLAFGLFPVTLTADELSYLLFALLYSPEAIALVPDLLLQLENGQTEIAEDLISIYGWGWGFDFVFLTYMCTDIVPASSTDQVETQQIGIPAFDRVDDAPDGRGHTAEDICEKMKLRQTGAPALREVTPTTPAIVFSGSMDPITPFSSGVEIADSLPNGMFVGFNDLAHGVTTDPCGAQIALAFLEDPEAEPDVSCSLPENRPPFTFGDN